MCGIRDQKKEGEEKGKRHEFRRMMGSGDGWCFAGGHLSDLESQDLF